MPGRVLDLCQVDGGDAAGGDQPVARQFQVRVRHFLALVALELDHLGHVGHGDFQFHCLRDRLGGHVADGSGLDHLPPQIRAGVPVAVDTPLRLAHRVQACPLRLQRRVRLLGRGLEALLLGRELRRIHTGAGQGRFEALELVRFRALRCLERANAGRVLVLRRLQLFDLGRRPGQGRV
ncbi:hypothetical protein D3C86_1313740 [compost metagenome]